MKKISIMVPCSNEEKVLPLFYQEITKVFNSINYDYELMFIDDGSKDNTSGIIKDIASKDNKVKYISFSRNFGKESAMYAGFCNADGDYIGVMDADMQDPPSLLTEMIKILDNGDYDCVATRRVNRKGEPHARSFFARQFYKIINRISDANIVDGARDFRLMKKSMVEAIIEMSEYNRFSKGIFGWIGFKTYWLSYENVERAAGNSKWNFWGLFNYAIDGIINFSQMPLSISLYFGLFMTLVSFIAIIFVIVRKLIWGDPVDGWASTICVIVFIGGIQLMCIGIMSQYLAKTYLETKNRPHYIVCDTNKNNVKKVN